MSEKTFSYTPTGVCSRKIVIRYEEDRLESVTFEGGCSGNTQGVAALSRGMNLAEVALRLRNIDCKGKGTSCPDQFAAALSQILESNHKE